MTRRSAEDARRAILEATSALIVRRGYQATTLDAIAERVEVTRGGILYHFGSKDEIIRAMLDPLIADLDAFLDTHRPTPAPTMADQEAVLTPLVDLLLRHRHAIGLVARCATTVYVMGLQEDVHGYNMRLARLLVGDSLDTHADARVRAVATLAAITAGLNPRLTLTFDSPEERTALVRAALNALRI